MSTIADTSTKAETCDYCKDTPAIMHFWTTNKNCCGSTQCERMAKTEAAQKQMAERT